MVAPAPVGSTSRVGEERLERRPTDRERLERRQDEQRLERRRSSSAGAARRRRGRPSIRRVRRTVRQVDAMSVLKISLFFYGLFVVAWLVFVAIVYWIAGNAGLFEAIENFQRGFAVGDGVDISLWLVERWAFLLGLTLAVVGSIVNLVLAVVYNIAADVLGGIEITFVEREL